MNIQWRQPRGVLHTNVTVGMVFKTGMKTVDKHDRVTVYYDGACPACVRDRKHYEKLAGKNQGDVYWYDITGKDDELRKLGIDPLKALKELHVKDDRNQIHIELDAYILLMNKVMWLKPLAWFISLPVVRPLLSRLYRRMVTSRLRKEGRLPAEN